jgi:hypothetical protein
VSQRLLWSLAALQVPVGLAVWYAARHGHPVGALAVSCLMVIFWAGVLVEERDGGA